MNFDWDSGAVDVFDQLWNEGRSISYIAEAFERDIDEVAILAIDRVRKGFIKKRPGGAYGYEQSI